jgi:hypothetical protein
MRVYFLKKNLMHFVLCSLKVFKVVVEKETGRSKKVLCLNNGNSVRMNLLIFVKMKKFTDNFLHLIHHNKLGLSKTGIEQLLR